MPKGSWTAVYIGTVVVINWLFVVVPMVPILGTMFPPVMFIVGFVFVFRDFAQREIGHWVIAAMLVAGLISYFMSAPYVAIASVTAFLISEIIDWAVYTFTGKSLAQRIGSLEIPPRFAQFVIQSCQCDLQGGDDARAAWVLGFGRTVSAVERGRRPA